MKRTILVGVAACALLTVGLGTAAAEPLTLSDVDITPGSAADLGNAVGNGSVNVGSAAAGLGSAFGGGYVGGVLSGLSSQ